MIANSLKNYFEGKSFFTRNELFQFYLLKEPSLNKNTFAWRIYNLKRKRIIQELGRGQYSFCTKENYILQLDKRAIQTAQYISKTFFELSFCVSNSAWINEFTSHQYSNNFTIVEVEKDFIESMFYNLKEKFKTVFLKPNEIELERYISDLDTTIILIPFLTRAPIQKSENGKYNTPTLEKLIVDIYTKTSPYFFLTNSETAIIIINAFKKYSINQTTLLAYAERRGKKKKIRTFLTEKNLLEVIND